MRATGVIERIRIHAWSIWFNRVIAPGFHPKVRPGEIVIDCDAHIAGSAQRVLDRSAVVHAFESHSEPFAPLASRFGGTPNVHSCNQSVSTEADRLKRDPAPDSDPMGAAQASSLMAVKNGASTDRCAEGAAIGLTDFLSGSGRVRWGVEFMVVKTRERSLGLKPKHAALQPKIAKKQIENIVRNWR